MVRCRTCHGHHAAVRSGDGARHTVHIQCFRGNVLCYEQSHRRAASSLGCSDALRLALFAFSLLQAVIVRTWKNSFPAVVPSFLAQLSSKFYFLLCPSEPCVACAGSAPFPRTPCSAFFSAGSHAFPCTVFPGTAPLPFALRRLQLETSSCWMSWRRRRRAPSRTAVQTFRLVLTEPWALTCPASRCRVTPPTLRSLCVCPYGRSSGPRRPVP
jgi:hypothetical protein